MILLSKVLRSNDFSFVFKIYNNICVISAGYKSVVIDYMPLSRHIINNKIYLPHLYEDERFNHNKRDVPPPRRGSITLCKAIQFDNKRRVSVGEGALGEPENIWGYLGQAGIGYAPLVDNSTRARFNERKKWRRNPFSHGVRVCTSSL